MGSWLNKWLWTFLEALCWVSVMYIVAHGVGSLPFHDHRTWQVEAHPGQWEMTTQLRDRVVWHKGPRYGFMGGQSLEGDGHRSLWCPCSGDGGTPLDPSGGSTLALASAVLCCWWALLLQEQCCVFLLSEYLVLSGCLILQDPLVRGLWEWMTRLMSRMMLLMRSWTASSSRPPKCPVSEWCRGRGSAPGPTGSLVSALELGCGTLPAGPALWFCMTQEGQGLRGGLWWIVIGARRAHLCPSTKDFVLDSQHWPLGRRGAAVTCPVYLLFLVRPPPIHTLSPGRCERPLDDSGVQGWAQWGPLPSTALDALLRPYYCPSPSIRGHFQGWRLFPQGFTAAHEHAEGATRGGKRFLVLRMLKIVHVSLGWPVVFFFLPNRGFS